MFNMKERLNLVKLLKSALHYADYKAPHFTDVKTPSVNYKEDFGTVAITGTNLIIAVTTIDDVVTVTDTVTQKVKPLKMNKQTRVDIVAAMLEFKNCYRY